ncbi:MAG: UDP-N-acetylmuramoyl-L-alanyl-D-glutamate--2,6-diaminopimelate ligase [Firmicutes bacterium]|nr:UDP-N-acetylmuramoyl-L-alanyl-D-glutamate--2,6-diaminopimelate ligase [Bacillota bacterium]
MRKVPLGELLEALLLKSVEGEVAGEVSGLACHTEKVEPGSLFFSLEGRCGEGWQYAEEAFRRGALAAVVARDCPLKGLPLVRVPEVRPAMALLADRFYDHPSRNFRLIGVTGTNGKTTTAHLIDRLFQARGEVTGLLGTTGYRLGNDTLSARATTPEAPELQELFARLSTRGAAHVTMEVSSHALAQDRILGCRFDIAVLTNITGEHLDFHKTFASYLRAKTMFFAHMGWSGGEREKGPRAVVLNADSRCYRYIRRWTKGQYITYGIEAPADVRAEEIHCGTAGIAFLIRSFAGSEYFRLPLKGRFNIYNTLAAISAGLVEGFKLSEMAAIFASFPGVPGRLEAVEAGQDYMVLVDFAHTPDGLASALQAAREFTPGRVITVFGCGGERDRSKRPLMGEAAGGNSDLVILTDDNPRGEVPAQIYSEVLPGLERCLPGEGYRVIPDRREAIAAALAAAGRGDLVLIAGKGHETEQIYNDDSFPFSDGAVARALIRSSLERRDGGCVN